MPKNNDEIVELREQVSKLQERLAKYEIENIKPTSYQALIAAINQGVQTVMSSGQLNDAIYSRIRDVAISSGDIYSRVQSKAFEVAHEYIQSSGANLIQDLILQSPQIRDVVTRNVAAVVKDRQFQQALITGFREAIKADTEIHSSLISGIASDPSNFISIALTNDQHFMDATLQKVLMKLRDAVSS